MGETPLWKLLRGVGSNDAIWCNIVFSSMLGTDKIVHSKPFYLLPNILYILQTFYGCSIINLNWKSWLFWIALQKNSRGQAKISFTELSSQARCRETQQFLLTLWTFLTSLDKTRPVFPKSLYWWYENLFVLRPTIDCSFTVPCLECSIFKIFETPLICFPLFTQTLPTSVLQESLYILQWSICICAAWETLRDSGGKFLANYYNFIQHTL